MAAVPGIFGFRPPIGPDEARRRAVGPCALPHASSGRACPSSGAILPTSWLRSWRSFGIALAAGLVLAASTAAPSAAAPIELGELMARFAAMPGLSADFREEKTLALLREPLVSEGSIYFWPPDHLARVDRTPVASRVVLDGDRLAFSGGSRAGGSDAGGVGAAGRPPALDTQLDVGAYPMLGLFVGTLRRILSGDLAGLEALYHIDFQSSGDTWSARLEPVSDELRRALSELRLRGSGLSVGEFVVVERSGDTTRMLFSHVDTRRHFDAAERARLFGMPDR